MILWITGNGHRVIKRSNERSDGAASLERITMAPKGFKNFKPDMSRANLNVLSISDAEIDMPNI